LKARRKKKAIRLAFALVVLAAAWAVMLRYGFGPVDRMILEAVYIGDQPYLKFLALQLGHFGAPSAVMLLVAGAAVYLLMSHDYWRAPIPLVATLLAHAACLGQQMLVGRPRPHDLVGLPPLSAPSFLPTRVVDPLVAYLLVALLLTNGGRKSRLLVAGAVLVGGSNGIVRVILGHHWPSDAVAGWAFGAAVALTAYYLSKLLPRNRAASDVLYRRAQTGE